MALMLILEQWIFVLNGQVYIVVPKTLVNAPNEVGITFFGDMMMMMN